MGTTTDQEIFDLAKVLRATDKGDTIAKVAEWRASPVHPVTKIIRIRTGIDITEKPSPVYREGRFGIVHSVFQPIGGTETWVRLFTANVKDVVGLATLDNATGQVEIPVYSGEEAIRSICRSADRVLVWGMTSVHRKLFEKSRAGQRFIAVCHGATNSDWAMRTFADQLHWCSEGVAVNEDVAKRFGCRHIPNIVGETRNGFCKKLGEWRKPKIVFWNHRPSAEKRPELALQIAERLPKGWIMVGTFGSSFGTEERKNVYNVGYITTPQEKDFWLQRANVFLATPTDEGFGYSVAEAVESLVPVVSSDHGIAQKYAVEILKDRDTPDDWVEKIVEVDQQSLRWLMGIRDRMLREFGADQIVPLWESL